MGDTGEGGPRGGADGAARDEKDDEPRPDVVVLVHGTFAADKDRSDTGGRWWQRGSEPWTRLSRMLPEGAQLPTEGALFHWSGANTQSARLAASTELLALLLDLERQGRGYHLVGHSHGGSVIWETLISRQAVARRRRMHGPLLAALQERGVVPGEGEVARTGPLPFGRAFYTLFREELELPGLRSWTTVGTPFLTHLPQPGRSGRGWHGRGFSLGGTVTSGEARQPWWPLLLRTAGSLVSLAALVVLFWPSLHHSPLRAAALVVGIVLPWALRRVAVRTYVGHALTVRARLAREAFVRFAPRWLGLFAATDEALAGLRALAPRAPDYAWLSAPASERPEDGARAPAPLGARAPTLLRLNAPLTAIDLVPPAPLEGFGDVHLRSRVYAAANRWLMPKVNRALASRIVRVAQGCDLPAAELAYASPWPLPVADRAPGLPERVAADLEAAAADRASRLGPELRRLAVHAATGGTELPALIAAGRLTVPDNPLLHTGYFDNPDVLALICRTIAHHGTDTAGSSPGIAPDLDAWLADTRERVARVVESLHSPSPGAHG